MENKNRNFTVRELTLSFVLIAIVFLGLYFGLVYYPLSARSAEVNAQLEEASVQLNVEKVKKAEYDMMREEIERIKADGDTTVMPPYNNNAQQEALQAKFSTILAGMAGNVGYGGEPRLEDGVRIRNVSISFTATSYEQAKKTLHSLLTTGFRCSLTTLSLSCPDGEITSANSVTVRCNIAFYELDV